MWSSYSTVSSFNTTAYLTGISGYSVTDGGSNGRTTSYRIPTGTTYDTSSVSDALWRSVTWHEGTTAGLYKYTSTGSLSSDGDVGGTFSDSGSTNLDWILLSNGASQGDETGSWEDAVFNYTTTSTQSSFLRRGTTTAQGEGSSEFLNGSDLAINEFETVTFTYSFVTTYASQATISYTTINTSETLGTYALGSSVNRYFDRTIYFTGLIGPEWSVGGSHLQFAKVFTDSGIFTGFNQTIEKYLETATSTTLQFEVSQFSHQYNADVMYNQTSTFVSANIITLTYDTTYYIYTETEVPERISFYNHRFIVYESSVSQGFIKYNTTSVTEVVTLQDELVLVGPTNSETDQSMTNVYLTTTRLSVVPTTISSVYFWNSYTFTYSSTYRKRTMTSTESSYLVTALGKHGEFDYTYSSSTGENGSTEFFGDTITYIGEAYYEEARQTTRYPLITYLEKSFYSLDFYNTGQATSYSQYAPPTRFAVASQGQSYPVFKTGFSPSSLLSVIYFKTSAFHRANLWDAPVLAIPINYTDVNSEGTTIQSVLNESFWYYNESASISRTTLPSDQNPTTTASISNSYTLVYAGTDYLVSITNVGTNDADLYLLARDLFTTKIYHTIGLAGTTQEAEWSMDGQYYWKSQNTTINRVISGTAVNPICPISARTMTAIGTSWVTFGQGNGCYFLLQTYPNTKNY